MERSVLIGIATLRWLAWVWMATVAVLARRSMDRPALAVVLIAAALVVTVVATARLRRDSASVQTPGLIATELLVAGALLLADGWVYDAQHVFSPEQPLAVAWPLAGVLSAGVVWGTRAGVVTGLGFGLARAVSSTLHAPEIPPSEFDLVLGLAPPWVLSLVTTAVLFALAGGVAGYVAGLLREAEAQVRSAQAAVAASRAREEVARTLHDGVLQTLAAVERRTDDPRLARLARDTERDLRTYLFGQGPAAAGLVGTGALGDALRAAATRAETAFGVPVQVLVPDDAPALAASTIEALAGAVGEACSNAGKHAAASRIVVFVEPTADRGLFCSVRDDGTGFDPATAPQGVGLSRSIRARIEELGGTVEVDSTPGRGTEIRLTLPPQTDTAT